MEQNFKKQATGSNGYILRGRVGASDKAVCIAVLYEHGIQDAPVIAAALDYAHSCGDEIHAFYVKKIDLAHYGRMDHLAPAGDMENFVKYVSAQDMEEAQCRFADLLAANGVTCRLQVLYGCCKPDVMELSILDHKAPPSGWGYP